SEIFHSSYLDLTRTFLVLVLGESLHCGERATKPGTKRGSVQGVGAYGMYDHEIGGYICGCGQEIHAQSFPNKARVRDRATLHTNQRFVESLYELVNAGRPG